MRLSSPSTDAISGPRWLLLLDPFGNVRSATARVVLRLTWRIALAAVSAAAITSAVLIAWRLTALLGLPQGDEPFDTADFRAPEIPVERDAFAVYPLATARFQPFNQADVYPRDSAPRVYWMNWLMASQDVRSWLIKNRPALDLWRQAADRTETSLGRPGDPDLVDAPRFFALLALAELQASRLETDGDVDGAWGWYRAYLRTMHHVQDYDPLHRAAHVQDGFPDVLDRVKTLG
jgi:hypothetical protein